MPTGVAGVSERHNTDSRPQFPLECLCSHRDEPAKNGFAERARVLLPERADLSYLARDTGLVIQAETELALDRPLAILKDVYGESVHIEPPAIRYHVGDVTEEPYMGVRVLCAAKDFDCVKNDLMARGAFILDAELQPPTGVIRATAPLRKLLGYSQWLAQQTRGNAREVMWFTRYAPLETPPREQGE